MLSTVKAVSVPKLVTLGCAAVVNVPLMLPLTESEESDKLPVILKSPPTDTLPVVVIVLPSKESETVTSPPLSNFKYIFPRDEGILKSVGADS